MDGGSNFFGLPLLKSFCQTITLRSLREFFDLKYQSFLYNSHNETSDAMRKLKLSENMRFGKEHKHYYSLFSLEKVLFSANHAGRHPSGATLDHSPASKNKRQPKNVVHHHVGRLILNFTRYKLCLYDYNSKIRREFLFSNLQLF